MFVDPNSEPNRSGHNYYDAYSPYHLKSRAAFGELYWQMSENFKWTLGLRYTEDMAVGTRFETLTRELGDAFIRVEFPGRKHSTLTTHRQQEGVDRVLAFFREKLLAG